MAMQTKADRLRARGALQEALEKAGGRAALANLCGVRRQAIDKWLNRGQASHLRARLIERALGVPARDLRPDIF